MSLAQKIYELFRGNVHEKPRFALDSGERQTGITLGDIRRDHVARYQMVAETIRERLSDRKALFGLDAFCATGYGTHLVAEAVGCPVLGIDASEEAIAIANTHYSNTFTFYSTKLFPFRLPQRSFDFIICLESVEHVADSDEFLAQILGGLKKGGWLFLSTPNSDSWSLETNPNPFHHRHFTRKEVLDLVERQLSVRFQLIDWYGQNIYRMEDDRIVEPLPPEEMRLHRGQEGQILLFVFALN